ncbi:MULTISPECIES: 4Fe-4S binding protein [Clostridium]|nr:4Fe-4S binding protein [Clostridium neonatale]MBS5131515.1 4Fe-4S binding protein [Lachnospiraceae bacterium]
MIETTSSVEIQQEHCLHCGRCKEICPNNAIERR